MNRRNLMFAFTCIALLLLGVGQSALAASQETGLRPYDARRALYEQAQSMQQGGLLTKGAARALKMRKSSASLTLDSSRNRTIDISAYVTVSPSGAELPPLLWQSSDPSIASVDEQTGMVTFKNEGKTKITCTATDGTNLKASMTITVKAVRVKKVSFVKDVVTLDGAETLVLSPVVSPSNATYPECRYQTSDASIATVDEQGVVTAHKSGIAYITAYADNPQRKSQPGARIKVQVRSPGGDTFTISAVGDVVLGGDPTRGTLDSFKKYLALHGQETGNPYTGQLIKAAKYFKQDDITLANLECTLTKRTSRVEGKYKYRGDPAYANILSSSSIEMVNIANNHTRDFGYSSYSDTKSALNRVGVGWNGFGYNESKIVDVRGMKIGFIGFQTGPKDYGANAIKNAVKKLRSRCDVLIVSLHFGDVPEYTVKVTNVQKNYARAAVDGGADLVVGHHPHVLSGMECYKGKNILYDLGSFLAVGPNPVRPRRTIIFQQSFQVHEGFVEVKDAKVIPFWITSTDKVNDMQPTPQTGAEAQKIISIIEKYSVGKHVDYTVVTE